MRGAKAEGANLPAIGWSASGGKPEKELRRSSQRSKSPADRDANRELRDLIAELRVHFDKVRQKAAWLELKQSELRFDDEISLFGMMDAKQECYIEQSLLSGHAFMVQQLVATHQIKLDPDSHKLLADIRKMTFVGFAS